MILYGPWRFIWIWVDSFPQFPPEDYNYSVYVLAIQNECPSYQLVGNSGVLSSKISLQLGEPADM